MVIRTLILIGALILPAAVLAEETAGRAEFEKGVRYFKAQEYAAALPYLQRAYVLSSKRPTTIRALAQCERALERFDDAILHFREYLESQPDDAEQVRETIKMLEDISADRKRAEAEKPKTPPPPPPAAVTAPPPAVPAPQAPAQVDLKPPPLEEDRSLTEEPLFWGAIALAVIGGGIALTVALRPEAEIYSGTTGVILRGPP